MIAIVDVALRYKTANSKIAAAGMSLNVDRRIGDIA
jgi:hypothetical protein